MASRDETFIFGVMTGIALVATVQYLISIRSGSSSSSNYIRIRSKPQPILTQGVESDDASRQSTLSSPHILRNNQSILPTLDSHLVVTTAKLQKIVLHMVSEFKKGLNNENEMIKMLPSYVVKIPTGNETGTFMALDLGGTNFRVCKVVLEGFGKIRMTNARYTVSESLKTGTGTALFDFFAESVALFCTEQNIKVNDPLAPVAMGFTFSFPCYQTGIASGKLIKWTKGFSCSDVEGQDVVQLLQKAFIKKGLNILIKALVNDTVGTLISHAYVDPQTYISVILGTGTNAAYVEKGSNVKKMQNNNAIIVMNTEWGNYGEQTVLPITPWDIALDRSTNNRKMQLLEKMISGMYLGELARFIIIDLVDSGELFNGNGGNMLSHHNSFETAYMARCERDHTLELTDVKQLLEDVLQIPDTTITDRRAVKHICELVGTRAARLTAAGIAAIVTKINKLDGCTVAVDGSVYERYPHFGNRVKDALHELLGVTAQNIQVEQARDGSGQGAALIAALA